MTLLQPPRADRPVGSWSYPNASPSRIPWCVLSNLRNHTLHTSSLSISTNTPQLSSSSTGISKISALSPISSVLRRLYASSSMSPVGHILHLRPSARVRKTFANAGSLLVLKGENFPLVLRGLYIWKRVCRCRRSILI